MIRDAVYPEFERTVRSVFPGTEEVFEYNMHGFRIKARRDGEEIKEWKGTINPNYVMIYLAQRKNGVTIHIWNGKDYYWLDQQKEFLTNAGFKVMRGCLQWNKKQPVPFEQVGQLLKKLKTTL